MKGLFSQFFLLLVVLVLASSCGKWIGDLRPDTEEESGDRSAVLNIHEKSDDTQRLSESAKMRSYKRGLRITREDFIDQSQEEGSLWASSGQTNYYFTKNKIRGPGDIVTVVVEEDLYKNIGLEIKSNLSKAERAIEVTYLKKQIHSAALAAKKAAAEKASSEKSRTVASNTVEAKASPVPAPFGVASLPVDNEDGDAASQVTFDHVNIYPALELKSGDVMMGEVLDRYPNGNYKVRATKRIPYSRGGAKLVSVLGIVKMNDISEDTDTVNSGKLYGYRVEVTP